MRDYRLGSVLSIAIALVVIQCYLPPDLFWPVHYLTSFFHEAGHALGALLTGGSVEGIVVQPSGGGYASTQGGIRWVVLSSGYLGTTLFGCALLQANGWKRLRGKVLMGLGIFFWAMALTLGHNLFTLGYGLVVGALFLGVGAFAWPEVQFHLVTFLGLLVGLDSIESLTRLLSTTLGLARFIPPAGLGHSKSDAVLLAGATGVPAFVWALLWTLVAVVALWVSVERAARAD